MTPRRAAQTRRASLTDAGLYLAKAEEFMRAAEDSFELHNLIAAMGNAVHAGISAADAIASARGGSVWTGEHSQAAGHLERVAAADGRDAGRHLRRLLPLKSRAEYDPRPVTLSEASAAVEAARRTVAIAERVVSSTRAE